MTPARQYALALVALVAGALIAIWAYGQTWGTAVLPAPGTDAAVAVPVSGQALWPGGVVAGWVAIAAALGVIATRSWGRQAIGVIAALAGLVVLVGAVRFAVDGAAWLDATGEATAGAAAVGPPQTSAWWVLAALAGLLVASTGLLVLLRGRGWPALGSRYERAPRRLSAWEAQDLGQDPTDDLIE